jgi:hypothetical protein
MIRTTRQDAAETLAELGVTSTADTVTLPRDFCLVALLNELGPGKEHYDVAAQVLREVEAFLGLCDGAPESHEADDCWEVRP